MNSAGLNYLILTFLNINPIFGGKLVAVSYASIASLNPYTSLMVIIITEILVCAISFHFANYISRFKLFNKKLSRINEKWVKSGAYIGFFVGQLFMGELFIALLFGLVEDKKNVILYFYVPMITSTVLYTLLYYYLAIHGVNLIKDYSSLSQQVNFYKKFMRFI
ncbi:MAG: hypothetical protein ACPLXO_02540 [Desulfurella sp.]|jgi:hypothetical protein|uniref:hypothetical protein n=1 Tax=Desulfurella sp. TaxID=1962857 RepID=UPI000CBE444E|nr:hypothetical protein [Desulfurella sp.]PMP88571.1 MAG: hypothetical protein C0173_07000 [Desulfurella sp.]